ncbi:tetratricopeptide repeat protein [Allorhizocola rhizosphaerae]|uniref:tetratricopeptide repeat protein n=1 Tax=Allorhizocola rhizosphaerae TaxID=1872709 RepID=UPI000E3D2E8C|nr:tetratricopeptide repeat protein [Allorhizocola rhizosphaerae]
MSETTSLDEVYQRASAAFSAGRLDEAARLLRACLESDGTHVASAFALAVCLHRQRLFDEAEQQYLRVLELAPDNPHAPDRLAALRRQRLQHATAPPHGSSNGSSDGAPHAAAHPHGSPNGTPIGSPNGSSDGTPHAAAHPHGSPNGTPIGSPNGSSDGTPHAASQPPHGFPHGTPHAVDQPKGRALAELLDTGEVTEAQLRGELLHTGRRRLLSHRRLWAAVGGLVALPVIGAVAGRMRDAAAQAAAVGELGWQQTFLATADALDQAAWLLIVAVGMTAALAMLSSLLTRYRVYERQLEMERGVLFRTAQIIRLYDVIDVVFKQNPILLLAGSGSLVIKVEKGDAGSTSTLKLTGCGTATFLRHFQRDLLRLATIERRSVKKHLM